MLASSYSDIIIGKNYLSLIYGLIRLKKKNTSSLLVDDVDVQMGDGWCKNIGRIEKSILQKMGHDYQIEPLLNIEEYLTPINTIIFLNEKMIEFGESPFSNVRELVRKLPNIFTANYINEFSQINPDEFDQMCFEFFDRMTSLSIKNNKYEDYFVTDKDSLNLILNEFIKYISGDDLIKKQLHFVLQVLYQTYFTNTINDIDSKYLLASLLSPRYVIDEKKLVDRLTFAYQGLGGVITQTSVANWEIYKNTSNYILLESVDGVVNFENLYYFGRITHKTPFTRRENQVLFNSIILECPLEHEYINFFKNKRIIISRDDRLGTDFPHWEIEISEAGTLKAIYSYANHEGTKASFYFKKVADDVFESLEQLFPGLNKNDWVNQMSFSSGADFWLENLSRKTTSVSSYIHKDSGLYEKNSKHKINNLYYFGPNRTQTLGLYSYALDLLESI